MKTLKASLISFFATTIIAFTVLYIAEIQEDETPVDTIVTKSFAKTIVNNSDILCLKQNIHYEADGEPFRGKVAVAMVTLNRTNILNKSICEVVFEPRQFSWTINKRKWITSFSDDVNFAANIALSGHKLIDELNNATNFHEAYTYPVWASEKRKITTIGNHVFYAEK